MQGHNQVEIKNVDYECVNSFCRLWKVLRTSMDSFIDRLNHVYKAYYRIFTWSTAFQMLIKNSFLRIHEDRSTF